jgi:hypothetical protein
MRMVCIPLLMLACVHMRLLVLAGGLQGYNQGCGPVTVGGQADAQGGSGHPTRP